MKWILLLMLLNINIQAQQLIPYLEDSKYGYSSIDGEVIIQSKYDEVGFFNTDNIAFVRINSKWLIINKKGEELPFFESETKPELSTAINKIDFDYASSQKYDTIQNVKVFRPTEFTIQFVNLQNFEATEVFHLEKPGLHLSFYAEAPEQFKIGYCIAKTQSSQFRILDKNAKIFAKSILKPRMWGTNFISYAKGDSTILIDVSDGKKIKLPYRSVIDIVKDKYLIVSNRKLEYTRYSQPKIGVVDWSSKMVIDTLYDNVRWSGEKDFLVQQGKHFFINPKGEKRSKEYDAVYRISPQCYKAQKISKQWVLLNNFGQEMELGEFDNIKYHKVEEYFTWNKNETTGIFDNDLNEVISYTAQSIYFTGDKEFLTIEVDGKRGLIDIDKNIIVKPIYDKCNRYEDGYIRIGNKDKNGLASSDGKILFQPIYDAVDVVSRENKTYLRPKKDGLFACYTTDMVQLSGFTSRNSHIPYNNLSRFKKDSKYHLGNRYGEPLGIIADSYSNYIVESDSTVILYYINEDIKSIYVIEENRFITAYNEDKLQILKGIPEKGIFSFKYKNMEGVINHKNKIILDPKKREITEINGSYIISKEDNKYYMYDLEGKLLTENGFDLISDFYRNLRLVGNYDQEKTYEFIKSACLYGQADTVTQKAMNIGYINELGEIIVPLEYNFKSGSFEKYTSLTKGLENGNKITYLVDATGKVVLEANYDYLYPLNHTDESKLYLAYLNDKVGLIDLDGNVILPAEYTGISEFKGTSLFSVSDTNLTLHLVNRENEKLFSNINPNPKNSNGVIEKLLQNNRYIVFLNGGSIIIDEHRNKLKKISGQEIEFINNDDTQLLKIDSKDGEYYLNLDTLVEYRDSSD